MKAGFRKVILWLLTAAAVSPARAQLNVNDSLRQKLLEDSARIFRVTKWKPYLRLENRNSFIGPERIGLPGFMLGSTYKDRHIFAAGFYTLWNRQFPLAFVTENLKPDHIVGMHYFVFSYLHVLLNKKHLQLNLPLEVGYGRYLIEQSDKLNAGTAPLKGNFVPYGLGLQSIIKPWRPIGLQLIGGYRFSNSSFTELSFRGWFYTIGIWLDARHFIRKGRYHLVRKKYHNQVAGTQ